MEPQNEFKLRCAPKCQFAWPILDDSLSLQYNLRRRVNDIDNIQPEECYYSDSSDTPFDPEEENEYMEDENEDDILDEECVKEGNEETYYLSDRLQELANEIPTCETEEGSLDQRGHDGEYKLCLGQTWNTKEEARHYLRTYAIRNKIFIYWEHNDALTHKCRCKKDNCRWFCRIRKLNDGYLYKLKSANFKHDCPTDLSGRNPMANVRWIAHEIEDDVRVHHKSFRPREIINVMLGRHFVKVKYWKFWYARAIALETMHGSYEDSYKKISQLCDQLLQANPCSIIKCSRDDVSKKWIGTCIAFKAYLDGFVTGCRLLIGVDGCFLKGKYGGVCLAMISLDGNDGMFPLGIYLCQVENKENWIAFFEMMKDGVNKHPLKLIIMSDRQTWLDVAMGEVFLSATQRFCFRHMYGNMKDYHRGGIIEEFSWNAARAYTKVKFTKWMEKLEA